MNFATFKSRVKAVAFPIGEPENQTAINDAFIVEALAEVQQYVPCYREKNVEVFDFTDTKYNCGLTVVPAPDGPVKRIYTVGKTDFCCRVSYRQSTLARLRFKEAENRLEQGAAGGIAPNQAGKSALALGDMHPDASSDSRLGRATVGYWAIDGSRMYLWPHIQSTERVVVEWSGIKTSYADDDTIYDPQCVAAVRAHLLRDVARNIDGNDAEAIRFDAIYQDELADLYHWCRQKTQGHHSEDNDMPAITNGCAVDANAPTSGGSPGDIGSDTTLTTFAVIGNYGAVSAGSMQVADMVNGWKPSFVVTTGGNIDHGAAAPIDYDAAVGDKYHSYLFPYFGAHGAGSTDRNRFWPAIGPQERILDTTSLSAYLKFMNVPSPSGRTYYDRMEGPLHLFIIDSGFDYNGAQLQPDGNTADSAQAEWLKVKLASSPCPFKVVLFYHPPFASNGGHPELRWPFKEWGATLVISGENSYYERLVSGGLTYLVMGASGQPLDEFYPQPNINTAFRYNANFAALRGTVGCGYLKLECVTIDGDVIDTWQIGEAPDTVTPTEPATPGTTPSTNPTDTEMTTEQIELLVNQKVEAAMSRKQGRTGNVTLPQGAESGSISGLNLGFTPRTILVTMKRGSGNQNLVATVIKDTLTPDGFAFTLSGITDAPDYVLDFEIKP